MLQPRIQRSGRPKTKSAFPVGGRRCECLC